ncbi:unnamed protein product [Amoebophrya sp. A25]|nr:unnamed protein product [Amoebophrya sp. A25]|eukprot:GSA25T00007710001.1
MDLLDNDVLALVAARKNVPDARHLFLSDGWSTILARDPTTDKLSYDLIVSNPPVHRGHADSFTVVETLLRGAFCGSHPKLSERGELWLVAQSHIPVTHILHHILRQDNSNSAPVPSVRTQLYTNGRFSVWRCARDN